MCVVVCAAEMEVRRRVLRTDRRILEAFGEDRQEKLLVDFPRLALIEPSFVNPGI